MVLESRRQDRIAGAQILQAPREADEVDGFRRVTGPYNLGGLGGVYEARDLFTGQFESFGGALG